MFFKKQKPKGQKGPPRKQLQRENESLTNELDLERKRVRTLQEQLAKSIAERTRLGNELQALNPIKERMEQEIARLSELVLEQTGMNDADIVEKIIELYRGRDATESLARRSAENIMRVLRDAGIIKGAGDKKKVTEASIPSQKEEREQRRAVTREREREKPSPEEERQTIGNGFIEITPNTAGELIPRERLRKEKERAQEEEASFGGHRRT